MQTGTNKQSLPSARGSSQANPFARALAEIEKSALSSRPQQTPGETLSEALARTGGSFPDSRQSQPSPDALKEQQELAAQKEKREALRRKLHDQVNPVNAKDIFDARAEQVSKEIDEIRRELQLLAKDVGAFQKDVEITLMTEVVDVGERGAYFKNFFAQLRAFIMLLRQKIKSARTWANASAQKAKKKKRRGGAIEGSGYEKTSQVQEMMNHEKSSSISAG
ncbi:MAG: hypothetical protein COY80_00470 [Candidatus Pacebacteria bacterium CG_4_10_14_0_8_um_filter_42_14]|nr:MAG: hypothetical protein COY80_00470 [Candidatus Pacebacteria bacterium CG_4_10_14_0_8_um_filter_42_14]